MNQDTMLDLLLRLTALFSAAVLLLALLRPLLLRALGAQATYLSWLLVPTLMAGPWLPMPALTENMPQVPPVVAMAAMAAQVAAVTKALPSTADPAPVVHGLSPWLLAWLTGAVLLAVGQVALQRRYTAALRRDADSRWLAPAGASPAVVGLWPQRLVLPQDFTQRFDATAQRLVLAHEAVHARRHDNAWNLLAAALLCLQWFNPLAWWAWSRLRHDQELACDAAVMTADAGPAPLAAYAGAMLAAHRAPWQPALASGWATRHPLVERVRMLSRHRAAPRFRHAAAAALVLGMGGAGALLARAAQEPSATLDVKHAPGQGMVIELASQLGRGDWVRRTMLMPSGRPDQPGVPWGYNVDAMQPGWCLRLMLSGFEDGSARPTVQVLDENCQSALGDWQVLAVNGRVAQLNAVTPQGPLQAQLSMRWVDPNDPRLPELIKAEQASVPQLSAAQRALSERQHQQVAASVREQQAQDRAWREAREAAPR